MVPWRALLLLIVAVPLLAQSPQRDSASASTTIRISVQAAQGIQIPRHVDATFPAASVAGRFAAFSSASGTVTLMRPAVEPGIILAAHHEPRETRAIQAGWSMREHRLPAIPVRAATGEAPRVILEVWQF